MNEVRSRLIILAFLLTALAALGQQTQTQTNPSSDPSGQSSGFTTVRGCLDGSRGNYAVIEDKTSLVYVLKGVGNRLDRQLRHEVEVKGHILPGTIKTGVRAEKSGSNPSDTVHGVDGVPLQIDDISSDIRTISKHCKAADQQ